MLVKIKIVSKQYDRRRDVLSGQYLNRMTGTPMTLLKDGTILKRIPDPKNPLEKDNIWEQSVASTEGTGIMMPYRDTKESMYERKRLVFSFQYEGDEKILADLKKNNPSEYDKHYKWSQFHKFHSESTNIDVKDGQGRSINNNKTTDKWEMINISQTAANDNNRYRLALDMGKEVVNLFDTDFDEFINLCYGIGKGAEVKLYSSDRGALLNEISQHVAQNPELVQAYLSDPESELRVNVKKAIAKGHVKEENNVFWIGQEIVAANEDELLAYFKSNKNQYDYLKTSIGVQKTVKEHVAEPANDGVVDEATIAVKCKFTSQRNTWVRARRNEYKEDQEKLNLFEERLKNVCGRHNWSVESESL